MTQPRRPSDLIRQEYGESSRNFMTPTVLAVGGLPGGGAYELSTGDGLGGPIWGVTVVRLNADGTTRRDRGASGCYHSRADADAAIAALKGES